MFDSLLFAFRFLTFLCCIVQEVNFKYKRTSHLFIGPPIAQVKQTHFCRVEGDNKFVLVMSYEVSGIPYADCFAVEIRWVVRREGASDLRVEVGVFVDFKKQTL